MFVRNYKLAIFICFCKNNFVNNSYYKPVQRISDLLSATNSNVKIEEHINRHKTIHKNKCNMYLKTMAYLKDAVLNNDNAIYFSQGKKTFFNLYLLMTWFLSWIEISDIFFIIWEMTMWLGTRRTIRMLIAICSLEWTKNTLKPQKTCIWKCIKFVFIPTSEIINMSLWLQK